MNKVLGELAVIMNMWGLLRMNLQVLEALLKRKGESNKNELVYLFLDARLFVYLSSAFFPTYGL